MPSVAEVLQLPDGTFSIEYSDGSNKVITVDTIPSFGLSEKLQHTLPSNPALDFEYYGKGQRKYDTLYSSWLKKVHDLKPFSNYTKNMGSVVYVDFESKTNGTGTFASPRNQYPGFTSNQTVLLKENTICPAIGSIGGVTNFLIGTYCSKTGRRVLERSRLATIDAAGALGINLSGASINTWISGLRVINFSTCGFQKGQNSTAVGGGFEYCVAENAVKGVMSTCFQSFHTGSTIRFCVVNNVSGDGIWCGQNTNSAASTKGFSIYGNFIKIGEDDSYDGPDGIQLSSNNGEVVGQYVVHTNWVENRRNRKQVIIATYNNTLTNTDSFEVYDNYVLGADTSLPKIGVNSQNGIYSEIPNTSIYTNYVENSRLPIVVSSSNAAFVNGCNIFGNLIYVDMLGLLRTAIDASATSASTKANLICNNTIVGKSCSGSELGSILPAISSIGPCDIRNNIIIGSFWNRAIQVNATNAASLYSVKSNAFDVQGSSFLVDTSLGTVSLDADSFTFEATLFDDLHRPKDSSFLDFAATNKGGINRHDVYGNKNQEDTMSFGAISTCPTEPGNKTLVLDTRENRTSAWFEPTSFSLKTAFSIETNTSNVLSFVVESKTFGTTDSSAVAMATVDVGGSSNLVDTGVTLDCYNKDLIRVRISNHNAHGRCKAILIS